MFNRCLPLAATLLLIFGLILAERAHGQAADGIIGVPSQGTVIDVTRDVDALGLGVANAKGDGKTDDGPAIRAAIEYVASMGGGTVYLPEGTYLVGPSKDPETKLKRGIEVLPGVSIIGAGRDVTTIRPSGPMTALIHISGGGLHNLTVYGTPSEEVSGDHWIVGTEGTGKNGTAVTTHNIMARDITDGAVISNVASLEAGYDTLYTRGTVGLKVLNSRFDRAGRNIVSMVGTDREFLFSDCYFGSLWGLYHVDIEPVPPRFVQNGAFVNCTFDGTRAGEMGTDTWGSFFCFSGDHSGGLRNRNIAVIGCEFRNIYVRVRGVFPGAAFLNNRFDTRNNAAFVRIRTNPVGEFRDTFVRGNDFLVQGQPRHASVVYGAAFTGSSIFDRNRPAATNEVAITEMSDNGDWVEEHWTVEEWGKDQQDAEATEDDEYIKVSIPLRALEYSFAERKAYPHASGQPADLAFHADPLIALGNAGLKRLDAAQKNDADAIREGAFSRAIFGVAPGDVLAVKTNSGKFAVMEIIDMSRYVMSFRYKMLAD